MSVFKCCFVCWDMSFSFKYEIMSSEKSRAESDKSVNIMNIAYTVEIMFFSYSILTILEFLA